MKRILVIAALIVVIVLGTVGSAFHCALTQSNSKTRSVSEVKPLHITPVKKNTIGIMNVYDENGELYCQYYGEIDIKNNGLNGEKIEIEIHFPTEEL